MRKKMLAGGAAAMVALLPIGAAHATGGGSAISEDEFAEQLLSYAEENPSDVEGFAELAEQLGGETESTSSTLYADEVPHLSEWETGESDGPGEIVTMGNFPDDVFTVSIVVGSVGDTKIVAGGYNWRDNFAGQAAPFDVAALRFSDDCGGISNLKSTTTSVGGKSTSRTSLRDSGVGTNAPVWNVNATTSGFENQADRGSFSARFDTGKCGSKTVRAAFDYEGNQGGSLASVSAGWKGLSVSYNNPGLVLKKSTQPVILN